jgi:hypothetical protein
MRNKKLWKMKNGKCLVLGELRILGGLAVSLSGLKNEK